jgi:hypothetical protein
MCSPFTIVAPEDFWLKGDKGQPTQYTYDPALTYYKDVQCGPLNQRSWVLQERWLSKRIMHFTKSGVYWECLTGVANETYRDGLPKIQLIVCANDSVTHLKKVLLQDSSFHENEVPKSWTTDLHNGWEQIGRRYSECQLTFASDKLVALEGITSLVGLKTGDTLVWGLWRQCLVAQLLWVHTKQMHRPRINAVWRAPSWSWAQHDISIRHVIDMPLEGEEETFAVIEDIDVDASPY